MTSSRACALTAAIGLSLAACGTGSDSADQTTPGEPAIAEPAPTESDAADSSPTTGAEVTDLAETAETQTPPESTVAEPAPAATQPAATESASAADTAPPTEPASPEVGGRALATTVEPPSQFDANPFPDLVVEDIGRSGEANIANILPSDRPVLLWTWAPH